MARPTGARWMVAHLVVVGLAILFVNLGLWQLRRLEERRVENVVGETRFSEPAAPLLPMLAAAGADLESLTHRRAHTIGVYAPEDEVLIRSQVYLGTAGFHVITPLVLSNGDAVLVNRGWIPLALDQVPVVEAPPPPGMVTVTGWVRQSGRKGPLSPPDPDQGRLTVMNRVDVGRVDDQVAYNLLPVYLVVVEGDRATLPIPVAPPSFDDEGPHLAYAVQWFGFALTGLVGYWFLLRRAVRSGRQGEGQVVDDFEPV